jgi:hypothetical protein
VQVRGFNSAARTASHTPNLDNSRRPPYGSSRRSSAAVAQLNHGDSVTRGSGFTNDCRSSSGVPASFHSMYERNAKSNPPSHHIVIVTLILLSYSR